MTVINLAKKDPQDKSEWTKCTEFTVYTERQWDKIEQLSSIDHDLQLQMRAVAKVLPFRINQYVIDELINWNNVPNDPIFQLTFPQPGMLAPEQLTRIVALLKDKAPETEIKTAAKEIQQQLNPHPAGQQDLNVPVLNGQRLPGMQHKYRETVLFFPSQGQTCHSYCTFCFRWAQFVGDKDLKFASNDAETLHQYLAEHKEVSDLLMTGGDPMVMKTRRLEDYLLPLTEKRFDHIQTIRIGSKALTFWPQRFVTDNDADDLLRLLEQLVNKGKHIAFMAHFNHWQELDTPVVREAIRRIRETGAEIRSQAPLLANINDSAAVWTKLWNTQVQLGIIPYYMFVERDTGAKRYFEVPLARAWTIYRNAMKQVSGLGRTARGPSMSAGPGKVEVQGITEVAGEKVFVLRFIQGRDSDWIQKPFFAKYDEAACWLNQLQPAFGDQQFFFEDEYHKMRNRISINQA